MGFWSDLGSNIASSAGNVFNYGKNAALDYFSPENLIESGLYTLLAGGNRGDYFKNAGINTLLRNSGQILDPRLRRESQKVEERNINANKKRSGPPVAGSARTVLTNNPGGGIEDLRMNLSFEEGSPLEPIPLSQNVNFNDNNKSGLLNLFGGSNQGTRGGFDMGDITYQDKPMVNQSTGEVTGIIRYYSTGAVEQLDREGNLIGEAGRFLRKPDQRPAYFGRGTEGFLSDIGQYGMGTEINKLLLKKLFPDQFRTRREASELANLDYQRQVEEANKRFGGEQLFANMMGRRRQMAKGGIANLAGGGFPRKTGGINGPGTGTSDDIPAMLSDGEFVMTAEAVRNAGGGSREKGTQKMYALMDSLENARGV
tara:strand:- start:13344 stop:14453 length:1110 start_codon:yes stop_codon:yes gene_type:complete